MTEQWREAYHQLYQDWIVRDKDAIYFERIATSHLELLRRIDEWLQTEPDCPFCGIMTWNDDIEKYEHSEGCELMEAIDNETRKSQKT